MKYNRNNPATTIVPYIFLFKNKRTIKDNQERADQYTDLFGWHKNPSTTRRKDIRTPTVKWMHLMYQIGATLFRIFSYSKAKEQLRIIKREQISTLIFLGGIKIHILHVERI